jgi:dCTP deaminase
MIKPDQWIIEFAENGGISPFVPEHVNPASYDVTVGNHWICPTRDPEETIAESIILFPGEVILATTQEYIKMPRDVVCDLKLKSSLGRLWLNHSLSGYIDPGFQGQVTLELQNLGPYPRELVKGMRIAQLVFMGMAAPPEFAYGEGGRGHYQGQSGATKSWSDEFFPRVIGPKKKGA